MASPRGRSRIDSLSQIRHRACGQNMVLPLRRTMFGKVCSRANFATRLWDHQTGVGLRTEVFAEAVALDLLGIAPTGRYLEGLHASVGEEEVRAVVATVAPANVAGL